MSIPQPNNPNNDYLPPDGNTNPGGHPNNYNTNPNQDQDGPIKSGTKTSIPATTFKNKQVYIFAAAAIILTTIIYLTSKSN